MAAALRMNGKILSISRLAKGFLFRWFGTLLLSRRFLSALPPSFSGSETCGVLGHVSISAPDVVLRRYRPGKADDLQGKRLATCFPLCVLGVACGGFLTG